MGFRSGMLVLWLCACGMASNDTSLADSGTGGGGTGGGGGVGINRSGTRIKMKVLNTPDGAKVFQGSYDTQRNEDCSFASASDGVMRCLPVFRTDVAYATYLYADAACTIPAASVNQNCPPPSYIISYVDPAACVSSIRYVIQARGPEVPTGYSKSDTSCVVSTSTGVRYYQVGAEIPPSSFQSATPSIE